MTPKREFRGLLALLVGAAIVSGTACGDDGDGTESDARTGGSIDAAGDPNDALPPGITVAIETPATAAMSGAPCCQANICAKGGGGSLTYTLPISELDGISALACAGDESSYIQFSGFDPPYVATPKTAVDTSGATTDTVILSTTVGTIGGDGSISDLPKNTDITITTNEFSEITFRFTKSVGGNPRLIIQSLTLAQ